MAKQDDEKRGSMFTQAWIHNTFADFRCSICGSIYEQACAAVSLFDDSGTNLGDVCPTCVEAGPVQAAERARARARDLKAEADEVDQLAEALVGVSRWATVDDLAAAERSVEEEYKADPLVNYTGDAEPTPAALAPDNELPF